MLNPTVQLVRIATLDKASTLQLATVLMKVRGSEIRYVKSILIGLNLKEFLIRRHIINFMCNKNTKFGTHKYTSALELSFMRVDKSNHVNIINWV